LTPQQAELPVTILRSGDRLRKTLKLSGDWRRDQDPSWRASLHVAGPGGGFWGRKLTESDKRKRNLKSDALAMKVTFIWAPHAKRAGFRNGDVVVSLNGVRRDMSIRQLHAYLHLNAKYGETIPVIILRGGKEQTVQLTLPSEPPKP
ncbi:MAG: PDZ domain-containing protein, partial [Planctomycetales bacterium]